MWQSCVELKSGVTAPGSRVLPLLVETTKIEWWKILSIHGLFHNLLTVNCNYRLDVFVVENHLGNRSLSTRCRLGVVLLISRSTHRPTRTQIH